MHIARQGRSFDPNIMLSRQNLDIMLRYIATGANSDGIARGKMSHVLRLLYREAPQDSRWYSLNADKFYKFFLPALEIVDGLRFTRSSNSCTCQIIDAKAAANNYGRLRVHELPTGSDPLKVELDKRLTALRATRDTTD